MPRHDDFIPAVPVLFAWLLMLLSPASVSAAPPSFRYDVLPVLTKSGCNSGTCHGTPTGKNGFRLSLRGYFAELDLVTLVREAEGRRVNLAEPDQSLVLLKATNQVPHQGGSRIAADSQAYAILRDWIASGARDDAAEHATLAGLTMTPAASQLHAPQDRQRLTVRAHFSDGQVRDVTHLARYSVHDEAIGAVTANGVVTKLNRGEAIVSAEYCNQFASARLTFLEPVPEFRWPDPPEHNDIDRLVFAKLRLLSIEPSPLSSDAEFVRRLYLDVNGALPTAEETRRFLASDDPAKRTKLIDELLQRPQFADCWTAHWADRLGCNRRFAGKAGAPKYHLWIRHAMATNMPEDEFARQILTAGGPNYSSPAATFWRRLRVGAIRPEIDPSMAAEEVSQLFLGVRIQCARCHNHPQERWTQDDFYGLAAFFTRLRFKDGPFFNNRYDKEEAVYLTAPMELKHPRSGETVQAKALDAAPLNFGEHEDPRVAFADWLTRPENPFFARMAVNRIWYHLFGRGLVEPVDDMRSSNPASHEELLDLLARDFAEHGFDRKQLIRQILNSRVYQLSSASTATNADDHRYQSHAQIRLLASESLLDAICQVTGVPEKFPELPLGTTAMTLPDGEYKHPFLEAFGRPVRASACECERDTQTNLSQALQLVSGQVVQAKLASDESRAAKLAAAELSPRQTLDELFLAALSRYPTAEERTALEPKLAVDETQQRHAIEDLLWMLINHSEFLFQH
jgi:hypothetical protein